MSLSRQTLWQVKGGCFCWKNWLAFDQEVKICTKHRDFLIWTFFNHILDLNSLTHSVTIRWKEYLTNTIWTCIWKSYPSLKYSVLYFKYPGPIQLPESIFTPNGSSKINAIKANQKGEPFPKQSVKILTGSVIHCDILSLISLLAHKEYYQCRAPVVSLSYIFMCSCKTHLQGVSFGYTTQNDPSFSRR